MLEVDARTWALSSRVRAVRLVAADVVAPSLVAAVNPRATRLVAAVIDPPGGGTMLIGSQPRLTATCTSAVAPTGLTDPTTVVLRVRDPAGALVAYTLADADTEGLVDAD